MTNILLCILYRCKIFLNAVVPWHLTGLEVLKIGTPFLWMWQFCHATHCLVLESSNVEAGTYWCQFSCDLLFFLVKTICLILIDFGTHQTSWNQFMSAEVSLHFSSAGVETVETEHSLHYFLIHNLPGNILLCISVINSNHFKTLSFWGCFETSPTSRFS